jgi:hypothetical protein
MTGLRYVGLIAAVAIAVIALRAHSKRAISRLNLLIVIVISIALALLAIRPSLFDPIFTTFHFGPGNDRRLIFALLVAVGVLFVLIVRAQSAADVNERDIRLLVEAFGQERFDWDRASALPDGPRLAVVMPAYNEAENIAEVIEALPEEVEGLRLVPIVVSDCSSDDTDDVARGAGALVARLPIRRGGGLALRVGYDVALRLDADVVATMDADGQHMPEELPVLIKPILAGDADHVNGSRMLGDYERGPIVRHVGVHFFSWVVTILTGQRVTDISSGYRATRADTLRKLILQQDQFWTSEVTIEALRQHARIVEVPVTFLTRRGGESKKPRSLRYGWHFSKAIIRTWLR